MKSTLLASFLFFCSLTNFAQNYQSVRSTDLHYFATPDLRYTLATRTDSVELIGSDSVFYSYKTVRSNDTSSTIQCEFLAGANWYGSRVIIRDDGYNLFFNGNNDTIKIQTQATLNDTFLVYVYPDLNDTIFGWVSDHDTMTVLGDLDSVKTINLFSTITWPLVENELQLSKMHGWVYWFAPYSFPEPYLGPKNEEPLLDGYLGGFQLVGQEFPRIGLTKPRIQEIYDFEPGERFIFSSSTVDWLSGSGSSDYYEREVVAKWYSVDTVFYTFQDTGKHVGYYPGLGSNTTYGGGLHTYSYTGLTNRIDTLLPEEFDPTVLSGWGYLGMNSCNRLQETKYMETMLLDDWPSSPCAYIPGVSWGLTSTPYIVGIGQLTPHSIEPGFAVETFSSLLYYAKADGDTCGTNSYLGIKTPEGPEISLTAYPNPANDFLVLKSDYALEGVYQLTITDLSGSLVFSERVSGSELISGYVLSVNTLSGGIYILGISNNEANTHMRFIKQ